MGADLIFVQVELLEFLLAFVLKCHDDEADKDVHHEKSDENDVSDEVNGYPGSMIENGSMVNFVGVNSNVGRAEKTLHGSKKIRL